MLQPAPHTKPHPMPTDKPLTVWGRQGGGGGGGGGSQCAACQQWELCC